MPFRRRFLAAAGAGALASTAGCLVRAHGAVGAGLSEHELSSSSAEEPVELALDHDLHPVAAYELGDADHGRHHLVVANLTSAPVDVELVLRSGPTDRVVYERALELDSGGYASWRLVRRGSYDVRIATGVDALEDEVEPGRIDCNWSQQVYAVGDEGVGYEYGISEEMDCAPWWTPDEW